MKPKRWQQARRLLTAATALCLLFLAVLNLLPLWGDTVLAGPGTADRLDPLDKAQLAEAFQLKEVMGELVWPGWGQADIPVILWNQDASFLVGYPQRPAGWTFVAGDSVDGRPYYVGPADGVRNFVVRVGDRWAASLGSAQHSAISIARRLRAFLPPLLARFLPVHPDGQSAEEQIARILHQSFHAYQVERAARRLPAVHRALLDEKRYWAAAPGMEDAWQEEIQLLARALRAGSNEEAADLARQFLAQRQKRRREAGLDAGLINYERQIEWLDGVPQYVALDVWRYAFGASDYQPVPLITAQPGFDGYATFDAHWQHELAELERQADRNTAVRLHYTGMAQAILLDWLATDWKEALLTAPQNPALEDLLWATVGP